MAISRYLRTLTTLVLLILALPAWAQVDWASPLGLDLGVTPCKQMQRQKRQTWDLWVRSTSDVTGGMAFHPEKPVVDDLPGLRRMAIVCDQAQGRVAGVSLTLPRTLLKEAADALTVRGATVVIHLSDPLRGEGQWRDETDYVSIGYDERRPETFNLVFTTEAFHRQVEAYTARFPRAPAWYEPPS